MDFKKALGKLKDETHSLVITEFVALSPKVYSLMYHKLDAVKPASIIFSVSTAAIK